MTFLPERCLATIWFGFLAGVGAYTYTDDVQHILFIRMILPVLSAMFGFFWGYKKLLQVPPALNQTPGRVIKLLFFFGLMYLTILLPMVILSSRFKIIEVAFMGIHVSSGYVSLFLFIALTLWCVWYFRGFLFSLFISGIATVCPPLWWQRILPALWFGVWGGGLAYNGLGLPALYAFSVSLVHFSGVQIFFVAAVAAYLGFVYGYQIISLPIRPFLSSMKASLVLGFIGGVYAFFIVTICMFSPVAHVFLLPIFVGISVPYGVVSGLLALSFYLLSVLCKRPLIQ